MTDNRYKELNAVQTAEFIGRGGVVVDVLTPEHHQARHIPGSRHACVYEVTFLEQVAALGVGREEPLLVYGAGAGSLDSRVAAEKLLRDGYVDVAVFPGGLDEWRADGRELEGEAPDRREPAHPELVLDRERYALVPAENVLRWTGRNDNGAHTGLLDVSAGELVRGRDGTLGGSFTLDMASIRNLDLEGDELRPVLEDHLRSDDFFFVSMFPKAEFTITSMTPVSGAAVTQPNYEVQGSLRLRGVSRDVAFPAHLRNVGDGRLAFMARTDLDRTRWGVIYGSARFFSHLGYHVVHDDISVDFRLVLE